MLFNAESIKYFKVFICSLKILCLDIENKEKIHYIRKTNVYFTNNGHI